MLCLRSLQGPPSAPPLQPGASGITAKGLAGPRGRGAGLRSSASATGTQRRPGLASCPGPAAPWAAGGLGVRVAGMLDLTDARSAAFRLLLRGVSATTRSREAAGAARAPGSATPLRNGPGRVQALIAVRAALPRCHRPAAADSTSLGTPTPREGGRGHCRAREQREGGRPERRWPRGREEC